MDGCLLKGRQTVLNWYLLYTKPKNEDPVSKRLLDNGFEVFAPKIKERKYLRRKIQDTTTHLFPCYVFVRLDLMKDYRLVKYTRGGRRLVGSENAPTAVPEEIIKAIRDREDNSIV